MTNPTPHGQVPEALIDLIDAYAETRHRCGGIYNAKTEAARKAVIEALSEVQALSAAPGVTSEQRRLIGVIADKIEDGTLFQSGIYPKKDLARFVRNMLDTTPTAPAASPTPPAEQAAPKAAPEVGNSGFDHQTAADFLSGKTVSDEAVRKFVAASRWAHDERAALSATLLAMHGVLTSREAEIALLKKALMEAEAAPQQKAQKPSHRETVDVVGVRSNGEHVNLEKIAMPPRMKAREIAIEQFGSFKDDDGSDAEMCFGALEYFLEWLIQQGWSKAPQSAPAPAPLSDDTKRLDWLDRNIFSREMSEWDAKYGHGPDYNMWVVFSPKGVQGSARNIIDAAIAAQRDKP